MSYEQPRRFGLRILGLAMVVILLFGLGYCFFPIKANANDQSGRTIAIPNDCSTIQAGVDLAQDGDTVLVHAGTYSEHVVLNKAISLLGVDGPIIDASGGSVGPVFPSIALFNGITVLSDNCTVGGFIIRGAANFGIEVRADHGV